MSKGGIKKKNREPSQRSRAARREASPSLDAGRAVRALSPAAQPKVDSRPSVLAIHHGAGVSKKAKTGRKAVKTHKQRRRHERGLDRAEAVADITAKKIERSLQQEKLVRSRKKNWDDVNKGLGAPSKKTKFGFELLGEDDGEDQSVADVVVSTNLFATIPNTEVVMDESEVDIINEVAPAAAPAPAPAVVEALIPVAVAQDDDEIM
ncbi:hypothetical protein TD95_000658 [Thielaviopsis punctulata]|uniref:Alb1-domain-containing protein n=1 Tax=Thielaviopsis punctulata TaxID=72032 RepID=A0A0F4ZKV3_9PEZI|nr:hypothetical protein TD95_000658 [Thielaviopsis punctulata]